MVGLLALEFVERDMGPLLFAPTTSQLSEPYRVCRRAHSERGWSPWHSPACTPQNCVNALSDWSSITPTSIPHSGTQFDRWRRNSAARSKLCADGCGKPNATRAGARV